MPARPASTNPNHAPTAARKKTLLQRMPFWSLIGSILLLLAVIGGIYAGLKVGYAARQDYEARQGSSALQEQYNLGIEDLHAGRYEIARQRFEWILLQKTDYPGAQELLLEAMVTLGATPTSRPTRTPIIPTATPTATLPGPTPTQDMRPLENLLQSAYGKFADDDWTGAIAAIVELRGMDRLYKSAEVDGLLYLSLRYRGIHRIYQESNLGGGSYDLSLAEQIGPLDSDASYARTVARLYLYGAGFTGADPEKGVYYFSQLHTMAPYLRDGTGMTSRERYRTALIDYGRNLMAKGQPCQAQKQYEVAVSIRSDAALEEALAGAIAACSPPASDPIETPEP